MSKILQGCRLIFRHLWAVFGHYVLAMSGMLLVATGTQLDFQSFIGSNVREASGLLQGCSLISRHLWVVSGTRPHPGCNRATAGSQPDFQAFLRSFWARSCQRCVRATAGMELDFQVISGSFWGWCAGHVQDASWPGNVWDAARMQPDFQAFLGKFLDTVFRPCQARQAMSGTRLGRGRDAAWFSGISRQFQGHGVQAMSRTHHGHGVQAMGLQN
ncbi:Hypothetical predicted protein [Olea europaea subsp. europaea]|uniref:Uncharacterized protein n=1 Tax=Olea europaea subsp. europaea TaxID=158383 RepID=A0A8S0TU84_OLEEU|nr:Hypothetical predicted protein [Olea europaea subsp. europaea]